MEYGIVYLLTNPYMPGLVKIGMTKQEDLDKRMKELYTTGVPVAFECQFACRVNNKDCAKIEKALHTAFEPQRVNKNREFFRINVEQAKEAVDVGAKFIVSPGLNLDVLKWCKENNILHIPGCVTATEMTTALNNGAKVVKIFPAESIGGLKYIKSVSSVFPIKFMPTGGISESNLEEYLSYEKVCACGGTWLAKKDMIAGKEWNKIEDNCKRAVSIINKCRKV